MEEGIGGDIWKRQMRHHRSEERDGPREQMGPKPMDLTLWPILTGGR